MTIFEANSPVSEIIPMLAKEKGLKYSYIAEKVGLSPVQMTEIIQGRRLLKVCEIPKLAKVLGVTPNKLYGMN